ncbi:N-acylneuraminate cytidylyltransferase/CMP-N,N'-diacetyllegionaminic acid synthase [Flavobacterium flevense]|uniref:CMP-N,N'-diacetyllegionaminic acid synthase n=1 Tax=Flavobacterium flevense TaxID=983 RepID=A0A4Y4B1T9_9FLAO|nr:acylneuraminate cytidylyltransferase family protein [Flavobacterium flevense]GEC73220.1 CMP-N,N'-diacetyllegionaminic acid synthase [Flavobacterium flevense]SHL99222.1 N-acylneuraminate cytidylyltransferase/CMP-N,N'-diacetyllegionaminic acid synthase [Flavobacterium flevense]
MKILITICARGGSKGIPGKNIKDINGKSLIGYSIDLTKKIKEKFDIKVALSTDDQAIKQKAEFFGLNTNYIRPDYLATDTAGKIDTIKDLLLYEESIAGDKYDFILDLDVTSPLRTLEDIENSLSLILENPEALNLFSVNPAARSPYFNMVERNGEGFYSLVKTNPDGSVMTRQSAPKVYDLNASFYWYRRSFFDRNIKSAITDRSLIYEMNHICFDLDHPVDFLFMEYLLQNNKLDFKI